MSKLILNVGDKPYETEFIANYVVYYCLVNNMPISYLKLHKILWYLQIDYLVVRGTPLFEDCFEAWDCGPIIPRIWKKYKIYGGGDIPFLFRENSRDLKLTSYIVEKDKKEINDVIDQIMNLTPATLMDMVWEHEPFKNNYSKYEYRTIPNEEIKNWGIKKYGANSTNPYNI